MPLTLFAGTFVFGIRLWAQNELHTFGLNCFIASLLEHSKEQLTELLSLYICVHFKAFKVIVAVLFGSTLKIKVSQNRKVWMKIWNLQHKYCILFHFIPLHFCAPPFFIYHKMPLRSPSTCSMPYVRRWRDQLCWWMTTWKAQWHKLELPHQSFCVFLLKCPFSFTLWVNVLWGLLVTLTLA